MFDDLTADKYRVVYDALNVERLQPIVDKIAKHHALSLVLIQNGHPQVSQYEAGLNSSMKVMFKPMEMHIQRIAEIVKTWPGFEIIGEKMKNLGPKMIETLIKHDTKQDPGRFFVLNHGDFHLRNLMFQTDEQGAPVNGIFLDYQMPVLSSPGLDLIGLLNMIGDSGVRKRRGEVLKTYHEKLVASLKKYGYKGTLPTGIDIQVEMLKMSIYDAFSTLLAIPMFTIKGVEMAELFNSSDDSPVVEGFRKCYSDPEWLAEVKPRLMSFYNRGIFDD